MSRLNQLLQSSTAKAGAILLAGALVAGCGGGDGSVFNDGDSAIHCVQQNGSDITNVCGETIIVKTSSDERLVIPPNETHRSNRVATTLAACFSPDEPEFGDDVFEFTCG